MSAGAANKEPADDQKEDSVFKAPPPPPKVTKCVTVPTDLYRDSVTALKCRKEHKEVHSGSHTVFQNMMAPLRTSYKGRRGIIAFYRLILCPVELHFNTFNLKYKVILLYSGLIPGGPLFPLNY